MAWTTGQQAAIDMRHADILVSAAAGSGKTAVLTERILKRVIGNEKEKGIDIDRFLIVTFTNAAAQEMKERIADKMSEEIERLQEEEDAQEKILYLERQLSLMNKASISTVHSFCTKTIKSYFSYLNIDPNIKIGDENELYLMKLDLIEEIIEEGLEKEEDSEGEKQAFLELVNTYGTVRGLEPLVKLILQLHTFSKSTVSPERWLDEMANKLCISSENMEESVWGLAIKEEMRETLGDAIKIYEEAHRLTKVNLGPATYEPMVEAELQSLQDIEKLEGEGFLRAIHSISFGRLPSKKQECDETIKNRVKGYRDTVKDLVGDLQTKAYMMTDVTLKEKTAESGKLMQTLVQCIKVFDERFSEAKKEKNLVDYNDLEHLCLKLLVKEEEGVDGQLQIVSTPLAEELADLYEEIYMDEYQDTNMVQETILESIASAKEKGPTRFMVGDMKQSIYRFRLANPLIFSEKYHNFEKFVEGMPMYTEHKRQMAIDLSQNFRSRDIILDATNDLFDQVMSEAVGELVYDEDAKLRVGNHYTDGVTEGLEPLLAHNVEVHLVEQNESWDEGEGEKTGEGESEDLKGIVLEAKMVAHQISKLLKGEANPQRIFDKGLGIYRQVEPRDIVILLRSMKDKANVFEEALLEKGIGAYADVTGNFFDAMEIQTMIALLEIIDNPRQDIPLITVLKSPIVRLNYDELFQIRQYKEEGDFYGAMMSYIEEQEISSALKSFIALLEHYREASVLLPLEELLSKLLIETGYYRYVGMLAGGTKKKANLKLLKKYGEDFEKNSGVGLFNFLQYLKRLKSTNTALGEAKLLGESDNLVRIMTIHKSKGLEFPIVFVANTDKQMNNQDLFSPVLMHSKLGLGVKFTDEATNVTYETIPFQAIKSRIKAENVSEEIRVLYVALTRAKEKLYITGVVKSLDKSIEKWALFGKREGKAILPMGLRKSATYLDWIGMSLFAHNTFDGFRKRIGEQLSYTYPGLGKWSYTLWEKRVFEEVEKEALEESNKREEMLELWDTETIYSEYKEVISARLSYAYPHEKATQLPIKLAVSSIKKKHYEQKNQMEQEETPELDLAARALAKGINQEHTEEVSGVAKSSEAIENQTFQQEEKIQPTDLPRFMRQEEGMKATTRGTLIHSVFEHVDLVQYTTKEAIESELNKLVLLGKLDEEARKLVDISKLVSAADSPILKRMRDSDHVWKEKAFSYLVKANEVDKNYPKNEEILIQGIIDTCFIEGEKVIIVDYKTDAVNPKEKQASIDRIVSNYRIQLELYSEALKKIMDKEEDEKWLYLYSVDEWVKVD